MLVAATVVVMGITTRRMADARLNEWTERVAMPTVAVAVPDERGRRTTIDLPGRLEAYSQAQLYARVSGYLKEWKADIGTPVKAGQLLAEIDAPDLDQQIMQAEADVASAKANLDARRGHAGARAAAHRLGRGLEAAMDQRAADAASRQGLLKSAQANLDRLRVLENYKRITAPFDGLVTSRTTDVGALINAGRRRAGAVRRVGHRADARLCQRAAELRAEHQDGHQGADRGSGISRQDIHRDGRGFGAGGRYRLRHDAHAAGGRQCRAAS